MKIKGRWYDPISYQFSFTCICNARHDLRELTGSWLRFLDDVRPFLLQEMEQGRAFQGATGQAVFPTISTEQDLALYVRHLGLDDSRPMTQASLSSRGFLPRDAIPAKALNPDWAQAVELLTGTDPADKLPKVQKKEMLRRFMNGFSEGFGGEAFPSRCFPPSFTPFHMEFRTIRCQTEKDYALFRESGVLGEGDSAKLFSNYRCLVIRVSVPRAWFHGEGTVFPLQKTWTSRLKELCGRHRISTGSVKTDVMYCWSLEEPLCTHQRTFKLGFRCRIGDLGWAMCMTDEQAAMLGGREKLRSDAGFDLVEEVANSHVYAQLTPDLTQIQRNKLVVQWTAMEPFMAVSEHQVHNILDIPISLRLGVQPRNIELTEDGLYSICL